MELFGLFICFWCTYSVLVALSVETIRNSVRLIVHEIIRRKCGDSIFFFFFFWHEGKPETIRKGMWKSKSGENKENPAKVKHVMRSHRSSLKKSLA